MARVPFPGTVESTRRAQTGRPSCHLPATTSFVDAMMKLKTKLQSPRLFTILWLLCSIHVCAQNAPSASLPHLEKRGSVTQLVVDGKPFLILGGELHNSSASSR